MTSLFDRVWHPREGDRQPPHFVRANLLGWPDCRRRALRNAPREGGTDYFHAFFGRHDHYRRSGVVSIRTWKKFFGPGSWTVYDGTHFMEEPFIHALLVPRIREILGLH